MCSVFSVASGVGRRARRHAVSLFGRLLAIVLAALALAAAGLSPAAAKTNKLVGVVFDDSGSMAGRTNLPVFGIQMLAASLTRSDRLYGMTFKQFLSRAGGSFDTSAFRDAARLRPFLSEFKLDNARAQQGAINEIKAWALNPTVGTPLLPVHVMLAFLAHTATADDDVHLFVFTDGDFNTPLPSQAELGQLYNTLKQGTKAKGLSVHFLAFVANDAEQKKIEDQNIAALLDQTFNTPTPGKENVFFTRDFDTLRKRLLEIIARIAETEPEDDQAKSKVVQRSGNAFTVNAPFTITKMVVISTAPDVRDMPRISKFPPGIPTGTDFLAEMERTDQPGKLRGADGRLWKARVTHLEPHPAMPANRQFSIEFDRPLTQHTSMLFRTDITVDWAVVEANGNAIAPDAIGVITVAAGQDYEIRAHIEDKDAASGPASLQYLPPEAEFTLLRRDRSGRAIRDRMQIDRPNNRATTKLRYDEARSDEVAVSLTMPGFVTARSRNIKINVIRNNVEVTLTPKPLLQCPGCSASRVEAKLAASAPWTPAMGVTARFNATGQVRDGKVAFALADPLPSGLRMQVPAANAVLEGSKTEVEVPFNAANPIELVFEVDGNFLGTLPDGYRARLTAKTLPPALGSGGAVFEIRPRPEDAELVFAGNTDGATGDTPLRIKPDRLDGTAGVYVRVLRPHGGPKADDFSIDIAGLGKSVVQQPQGDIVLVKPRPPGLCAACFVRSGRYPIEARFRNASGQDARLTGAMFIEEVTLWERFLICLWIIIAVTAALYIACGLWRLAKSSRFPRSSRLLIYVQGRRIDADLKKLARRPWPWVMPLVAPFFRWNEQRRIEGLSLEAGSGGVRLLAKGEGGYDNIRRGAEGRPVSHYFKDGNREPLEISWGERLEELGGSRRTFEFIESKQQI